jgi:hypothetical protein
MSAGHCIVVGGHSRGIGKTALVVAIVKAIGGARVATVKVSAHRHGGGTAAIVEDTHPSPETSTGRCLLAGAARAFLCRCPDEAIPAAAAFVQELVRDGWIAIAESNRLAPLVAADLSFFVVSNATADWKASSAALLPRADAIVLSPGTPAPPVSGPFLTALRLQLPTFRFRADWTVPDLESWVARRLAGLSAAGARGSHERVRGRVEHADTARDSALRRRRPLLRTDSDSWSTRGRDKRLP